MPRDTALQSLIESLSEYSKAIERAYAGSARFRSICMDFYDCSYALIYWEITEFGKKSILSQEYRELLRELKEEIVIWLQAKEDHPDPRPENTAETDRD